MGEGGQNPFTMVTERVILISVKYDNSIIIPPSVHCSNGVIELTSEVKGKGKVWKERAAGEPLDNCILSS